MKNIVLIVVDMEKEWQDKRSSDFLGDLSLLTDKINSAIRFIRERNGKIIFIKHVENSEEGSFAPRSSGIELVDDLDILDSDKQIVKHSIGSFLNTDLEDYLHKNKIDNIMVCGVLTNLCVRKLIEDAYDLGFRISMITDCCRAFDKETHDFTIEDLKNTRSEIEFITLNELLV